MVKDAVIAARSSLSRGMDMQTNSDEWMDVNIASVV